MFACPNCGQDVPDGAVSCKGCGADAETGWKDDAESVSPDLEDHLDDERYEEFLEEDLAGKTIETKEHGGPGCLFIAIVALLVGALIAWLVSGGRSSGLP